MRTLKLLTLAAAVTLATTACQTTNTLYSAEPTWEQADQDRLREANYKATTALMAQYVRPVSTANNRNENGSALIVATLANVNALEQSSTLGRLISEQIASRLTQSGQPVVELKVRNGIYMKRNEGEFLLTREIREVAAAHNAQGVIVGTYAEGADLVYVTLKLVDPSNSLVLAAYDYTLPVNRQIKSLIRTR